MLRVLFEKRKYLVAFSALCFVEGVLLAVLGKGFLDAPCTVLSIAMLICGAVILANGIIERINTGMYNLNYFAFFFYLCPSALLLFNCYYIKFAVIAILGLCGLLKIYDGIIMHINKSKLSLFSIIFGGVSVIAAVFLLFLQPLVNNGMYRPLGYALIISAVTDIISGVLFSYSAVEFIKNNRDFGLEDDEREE